MHIYVSIQLFSVLFFRIVCWRAVRLTATAVPVLFYSSHIKTHTHTNLAAAVQQACLCYYWWWMCVIWSIPLNRRLADPCVRRDCPQDLWASSGHGLLMKPHVYQGVCVCKQKFDHFSADLGSRDGPADVQIMIKSVRVYWRETSNLRLWKACVLWTFVRKRRQCQITIDNVGCILFTLLSLCLQWCFSKWI